MANTLTFPSEAFPAYPTLSAPQPEGWVALAAVGLPLALAREVEGKKFRANVLTSLTRVGAEHSFDGQVSAVTAKLKKLPRYKETLRELGGTEQIPELYIEGRFAGAKGELLGQFVRVVVLSRGYVYDVVEITGTVSLLAGDNSEEEVREIVKGVVVSLDA